MFGEKIEILAIHKNVKMYDLLTILRLILNLGHPNITDCIFLLLKRFKMVAIQNDGHLCTVTARIFFHSDLILLFVHIEFEFLGFAARDLCVWDFSFQDYSPENQLDKKKIKVSVLF